MEIVSGRRHHTQERSVIGKLSVVHNTICRKIHNKKKEILVSCDTGSEVPCSFNFFWNFCIYNLHKIVILFETSVQFPSKVNVLFLKVSKTTLLDNLSFFIGLQEGCFIFGQWNYGK